MGSFDNSRGIQTGVHRETSSIENKENFSFFKRYKNFTSRSKHFIRKRCNRTSTKSRESNRFLQYILSGTQKEWQNETNNKSQTPQRVSQENTLQNGHIIKGVKSSENRRLGHISRSKRCLSTCSNISYTSEISPILHSKPVLSIQSPLFRTNFSTKSLHKNSVCSGSIPANSRHKTSCISRRLADCKSEQKAVIIRSRELSQSPEIFRFSGKQRKIDTYPNPNSNLLGGIVSSRQGLNLSHSRENSQVKSCDRKSFDSGESISFHVSTSSRHYGLMLTNDSECSSVHETSYIF